jgi:DUF1680 family protein
VNGQAVSDAPETNGTGWLSDLERRRPVCLTLELPVRRIIAHPSVAPARTRSPSSAARSSTAQSKLTIPIRCVTFACRRMPRCKPPSKLTCSRRRHDHGHARAALPGEALYGPAPQTKPCPIRLIPYYVWNNRQPGEMRVWLPVAP